MPNATPEQIEPESAALRKLRTSLRVAGEDLQDLEKRIKYRVTMEGDAFREAANLAGLLTSDVAQYEAERWNP
jgi:DNA-binding GntR family transcriptional regulator